jgi:hypothetical protein
MCTYVEADVTDLGQASTETRGNPGQSFDLGVDGMPQGLSEED